MCLAHSLYTSFILPNVINKFVVFIKYRFFRRIFYILNLRLCPILRLQICMQNKYCFVFQNFKNFLFVIFFFLVKRPSIINLKSSVVWCQFFFFKEMLKLAITLYILEVCENAVDFNSTSSKTCSVSIVLSVIMLEKQCLPTSLRKTILKVFLNVQNSFH